MALKINPFTGDLDVVVNPGGGPNVTDVTTDSGTAVPTAGGVLTVAGGTGISTSGATNTVTITLDTPVSVSDGGTGVSTLTDGGVMLGSGTSAVTSLGQATDGQLVIGDTSADPVLATLTAGTGMTITNAAGSITLASTGSTALSFPTDSGTATPAANILTISGGTGISTSGSGSTVTITLDTPVSVANGGSGATTLTDGGVLVGSGTSAITALSVGTNGQLLVGSTSADPVFATVSSSDSTIEFTTGAGTLSIQGAAATDSQAGVIELATDAETNTGTATDRALTPANITAWTGGTALVTVGTIATGTWEGTTIAVDQGGTGATSLTDGGILLGSGTGAITPLGQATNGQLPIGSTSADAVLATITAGDNITVTNGAGTISLASSFPIRAIPFPASALQAVETASAPLELLTGTNVKVFVRAFDDTAEEFSNNIFPVPADANTGGTVTFRAWVMAKTAASSVNVDVRFGHLALNNSEDFDPSSPYTVEASGDTAIDSTQDDLTEITWTETFTTLGWAADDMVLFRFSRNPGAGSDLTGDMFLFLLVIECPRT